MAKPKLRFPGFEGEWQENTLLSFMENGLVTEHIDGNHGELYPRAEEFIGSGVPYISANSLEHGHINYLKVKYLHPDRAKQFKKGVCKPGDILFAHNATVGPVGIVDDKYSLSIISTTLTLYRINQKHLNNQFIKTFMETPKFIKQYSNVMKQSTRNQVPITMQRSFYFPVISLLEQSIIASFYQSIDKKIQLQQEKIDLLKEQKKGFMQKIFKLITNSKEYCLEELVSEITAGKSKHDADADLDLQYPVLGSTGVISYASKYDYEGDYILIARVGANAGKISSFEGKCKITDNTIFFECTKILKEVLIEYLLLQDLNKIAFGSGQPLVKASELKKIKVSVPSEKDQIKIKNFVNLFSNKINLEQDKLNYLLQQKQAFMQQMFI